MKLLYLIFFTYFIHVPNHSLMLRHALCHHICGRHPTNQPHSPIKIILSHLLPHCWSSSSIIRKVTYPPFKVSRGKAFLCRGLFMDLPSVFNLLTSRHQWLEDPSGQKSMLVSRISVVGIEKLCCWCPERIR